MCATVVEGRTAADGESKSRDSSQSQRHTTTSVKLRPDADAELTRMYVRRVVPDVRVQHDCNIAYTCYKNATNKMFTLPGNNKTYTTRTMLCVMNSGAKRMFAACDFMLIRLH